MDESLVLIDDDEPNAISQEEELEEVQNKLASVCKKIRNLESEKRKLEQRAAYLKEQKERKKCEKLQNQNWDKQKFEWSERLDIARNEIFHLENYRPDQLAVINASMAGHDCILIMPTGGGKSLTYQLPAVVSDGITLVVSPLLSLMEDQLMALKRLGINAEMLSGTSDVDTKKRILKEMLDASSDLKLLYVTPEKCSKSKQFMAKLQKNASSWSVYAFSN